MVYLYKDTMEQRVLMMLSGVEKGDKLTLLLTGEVTKSETEVECEVVMVYGGIYASLTFALPQELDEGDYKCVVKNGDGDELKRLVATIGMAGGEVKSPSISKDYEQYERE